ncbi:hypothetical protein Y032_0069g384 [Ancylostoma ceylanicum]|uniref:Uncharacterized protein n=1 Tax=Ancylostoma ceylanicum TaxID=53326 RepID=A0A016TYS7_9BILA|nr:hypothetical protein Y032_0069g384 [Ancylostoma ceylanicum]
MGVPEIAWRPLTAMVSTSPLGSQMRRHGTTDVMLLAQPLTPHGKCVSCSIWSRFACGDTYIAGFELNAHVSRVQGFRFRGFLPLACGQPDLVG